LGITGVELPNIFINRTERPVSEPLATCHISGENSSYWPITTSRLRGKVVEPSPGWPSTPVVEPSSTMDL
jgi:hypothetical protein